MSDVLHRLDKQLCFALYAASRAIVGAYQPLLEELGITYPQYLVFLVLWETDGLSVARIGERLALDSGTLTPLLKRLEANGLVERRRSKEDERVVEIHLTAAGKRLEKQGAKVPKAMIERVGLCGAEAIELRATLMKLTESIKSNAGQKLATPRKKAKKEKTK